MNPIESMKIGKYSGLFLIITGMLHTIIAFILHWKTYLTIINDGLINAIGREYDRAFAFWFLVCGVLIILLGQTLHYYQKREKKPAPLFLGYSMLIFAVIGCIINPISGFWLFIPQALIIIIANKK